MRFKTKIIVAAALAAMAATVAAQRRYEAVAEFSSSAARQAVAVDGSHVYAISNRRIVKYTLRGDSVGCYEDGDPSPLKHMNSGIVVGDKLYCAHSNYPSLPMSSTVEIFDTATMRHAGSISLGIRFGSLTWVLPCADGGWWAFFAHYGKEGKDLPGRDVSWSQLVRFDSEWRAMQAWVLPPDLVARVSPNSLSGAVLIGGKFYCTGHDAGEVYVLSLPEKGGALLWEKTIAAPFTGQGIAADEQGNLWGISRKDRKVIKAAPRN